MKTIFKVIILLGFLATASLVWAEIYKWVDEKGTVHFTDDPVTIPMKYKNQIESRETTEDKMTIDERLREKRLQEQQTRENMERQRLQYQIEEENRRREKMSRELKRRYEEKILEIDKQYEDQLKAIKKRAKEEEEEEASWKKCWNCSGRGSLGQEVMDRAGFISHLPKTCSICGGSGRLKK